MSQEQDVMGDCSTSTGAFVPDGIEPASGLDQRLQSPIAERLRSVAGVIFIYDAQQGVEDTFVCLEAAHIIDELLETLARAGGVLRDFIHSAGADDADGELLSEIDTVIRKARGDA